MLRNPDQNLFQELIEQSAIEIDRKFKEKQENTLLFVYFEGYGFIDNL